MAKFYKDELVTVTDWSLRCPMYKGWFCRHLENHDIPIDYAIRYKYGTHVMDDAMKCYEREGTTFKVLFATDEHVLITLANSILDEEIYLFDVEGVDYIRKTMTLKQVEDILGYHIEII